MCVLLPLEGSTLPHFYFDTDDGDFPFRDDDGLVIEDHQAARLMALSALRDSTRDTLTKGDRRDTTVCVRDMPGAVILTATLGLTVDWV